MHRFGDVGSTNDVAFELAERGEPAPFWVVAERQLKGRGRRARHWVSEPGNLYASLLLPEPAPPDRLGTLSLVAAVALRRAILSVPRIDSAITLKWPNDILIDGAKVSGILLEAREGGALVVIGCGVNCAHHPPDTSYPATDLHSAGLVVTPETLFAVLRKEMTEALRRWDKGACFSDIRTEWLASAYGMGAPAAVAALEGTVRGVARSIDMDGRLVMDVAGREMVIAAGDLVSG